MAGLGGGEGRGGGKRLRRREENEDLRGNEGHAVKGATEESG